MAGSHSLTTQKAAEHALLYAYPLLAFRTKYNALTPLIGINKLGHARQLSTSQARSTVRPNADTIYSTALYDVSQQDLEIDIPAVPSDQYALFSFHDIYGNNFAIVSQEDVAEARSFRLTHDAASPPNDESPEGRIASPTAFGTILIRWLFKDDNLNTIHTLQNATVVRPVPLPARAQTDDARNSPLLTSINWGDSGQTPAHNALRLLCEVGAVNTPGCLAGMTVQEVLQASSFYEQNATSSGVDIEAVDRSALKALKSAGHASLEYRNNGWSAIRNNSAGNFGDDYGLRAQIAFTGYLMLQAPAALYPSWSQNSTGPPLQGDILELGAADSYIYTFSGKPPLGKLGFWSLTVYDADGYLIENPTNVSSIGDRSNIIYPSGGAVYGSTSRADHDEPFQLLIQPADVPPPAEWTHNWLPGPSGGGNMTALLRFYNAPEDLLDTRYQLPVVSKQNCIVGNHTRPEL